MSDLLRGFTAVAEVLHNNGISIFRVPASTSYLVVLPRLVTPKAQCLSECRLQKLCKSHYKFEDRQIYIYTYIQVGMCISSKTTLLAAGSVSTQSNWRLQDTSEHNSTGPHSLSDTLFRILWSSDIFRTHWYVSDAFLTISKQVQAPSKHL